VSFPSDHLCSLSNVEWNAEPFTVRDSGLQTVRFISQGQRKKAERLQTRVGGATWQTGGA
jgi:hypothetical protein